MSANAGNSGNEFVKQVADCLLVPGNKASGIIRAVLHALRNRLSHEESFQLLSQLPMALKGVYADGWRFEKDFNRITHLYEFLDEIRKEDEGGAGYDFGNNARAKIAASAVFKALNYFVSQNEMNDITGAMPGEIKDFIRESIAGDKAVL